MALSTDDLLRTLAAVPPHSRILDLGCGIGDRAEPLAQLGYAVFACDRAVTATRARLAPYLTPDDLERRIVHHALLPPLPYTEAFFDWVIAADIVQEANTRGALVPLLREVRRVLKPGGWVYVIMPTHPDRSHGQPSATSLTAPHLAEAMASAALAIAQEPCLKDGHHPPQIEAIYRRVDPGTPL